MTLLQGTSAATGPVHVVIDNALAPYAEYRAFRRGALGRDAYCRWTGSGAVTPSEVGLNTDQFNLSTRFPVDEQACAHRILDGLKKAGFIGSTAYPAGEFAAFRAMLSARFRHGAYATYIFPEEARLLFALAHILAPRNALFPGSYYGYWAVWAMPGIMAAGGRATLVDVDADSMRLAQENFAALGLSGHVAYVTADAVPYGRTVEDVDLCVLDAEGPKDAEDPALRDKAVYAPIMRATTPGLREGCLLVAHNMLLENLTDNRYFAERIVANEAQYAAFHEHVHECYDLRAVCPTSEGVGIYRKSNDARVPSRQDLRKRRPTARKETRSVPPPVHLGVCDRGSPRQDR
ncbi:O-methyltransferase [Streptoverticillium reticulum]|uniref:O-methyltransferase n=1 Tax=Streptoverticillium reticulum TaxID=1433415 RepID=UPI0039BF4930